VTIYTKNNARVNLSIGAISKHNTKHRISIVDICKGLNMRGCNKNSAIYEEYTLKEVLEWLCENGKGGFNYAKLNDAELNGAKLNRAELNYAELNRAELNYAELNHAELNHAEGVLSQQEYINNNFEISKDGIIVYKTFGEIYKSPASWKIKEGAIIQENCSFQRTVLCGSGINFGNYDYVKNNYNGKIWECIIRWEWAMGICVPYNTDGKCRCEKMKLLKIVEV
jgi:hypothetical protein